MRWSFRIATIAGTEVRIHATFFLLLWFIAVVGAGGGRGLTGGVVATLLVLAMFFCVLLHEFGHVAAARRYGIPTPDITLLPFGGMARLLRMPRHPGQEFVVAICGPLVNVAIAGIMFLLLGSTAERPPDFEFGNPATFWVNLMWWNVAMVIFNMVPAFPMDGGRVLRALLAMFLPYERATRFAATVGQSIAMVTVLLLVMTGRLNPFLILIAIFVFIAAGQEAHYVTQQEQTRDLRVRDAMLTDFHVLPTNALLRDAVDLLLSGSQQDFPVLDDHGGMLGLLSRQKLIAALAEHGSGYPAQLIIEKCDDSLEPGGRLVDAMEKLRASTCSALAVLDPANGKLVGLLTAENVGETILVRSALQQSHGGLA